MEDIHRRLCDRFEGFCSCPLSRFLDVVGGIARVWSVRCMGDDEFRPTILRLPSDRSAGSTPPASPPASLAAAATAAAAAHAFQLCDRACTASGALSAVAEPLTHDRRQPQCRIANVIGPFSSPFAAAAPAASTIATATVAADTVLQFLLEAGGEGCAWSQDSDHSTGPEAVREALSVCDSGAGRGEKDWPLTRTDDTWLQEWECRGGGAASGASSDAAYDGCGAWSGGGDAGGVADWGLYGLWGPEASAVLDDCALWQL